MCVSLDVFTLSSRRAVWVVVQARLDKFTPLLSAVKEKLPADNGPPLPSLSDGDVDNAWMSFRMLLQDWGRFRQLQMQSPLDV